MASLARRWLVYLQSLGTQSGLMSEALHSANSNLHLVRVLKKYAPSTLTRYFAEWDLWCSHCRTLSCCPASPPSGVLPDWLSARVSSQGLATGPVRALTWFSRVAALENLSVTLQSALVKSFLVASSPSERRESMPLPLSFVVWLERLVCLPTTPPAEVHFAGTVPVCTWSALRWGDATWVPPSRLVILPDQSAAVGVALRTKTTRRSMPFGFVLSGLSGTPSASWAARFMSVLQQIVSDTLSDQPGRTLDFLPAVLSGPSDRPRIASPMKRELAVPRLLGLLTRFWSEHLPGQVPPEFRLYGSHSCKATTLAWSRQLNLDKTLRQLQGHHRLSGPDRSVELYGRDDVAPQLLLQRQLISRIRGGFRPLQPLARGSSVPLPDFGVSLPPPAQHPSAHTSAHIASVARVDAPLGSPVAGPVTTPGSVSPASVVEPATAPFPPTPPILDLPPVSTPEATSPQSASSDGSESPISDPEFPSAAPVASAPAAPLFLYNHRSNVVHAAVMCEHVFLKTVSAQRDGRSIHCKPVCGAKTMHLLSDAVVSAPPPGAQPCLRSACICALGQT